MKQLRNWLPGLLTVLFLLFMFPAITFASEAHISATADKEAANVGDEIKVTISLSDMDVSTFTGGLAYDSDKLTYEGVDKQTAQLKGKADATKTLDLEIAPDESKPGVSIRSVGISSVGAESVSYNGEDAIVTVTFTATSEGDAIFTLYENSDGTDGFVSEEIAGTTVTISDPVIINYSGADGKATGIKASHIYSCTPTAGGNYLLKDVQAAAGITTTADCSYHFAASDGYGAYLDADYYNDLALFNDGSWRSTFETLPEGYVGGWFKVSGVVTIEEVNHAYGEDHLCTKEISNGKNKTAPCGAEEEYVTYQAADGTATKLYSSLIESCTPTAGGNYLLSDIQAAAGITTKADCSYHVAASDGYGAYLDADYYSDIALFRNNGGWRSTFETVPSEYSGGWFKVSGVATIEEVNHKYENHVCVNGVSNGRNATAPCGAAEPEEVIPVTPKDDNPKKDTSAPKVGASVTKDGATYVVTADGTVSYTVAPKQASVAIPETISAGGKTYAVTAVAAKAFMNNKKVTAVTIPNNVSAIGESAFSGCSKLKSIVIPASVKSIGKKAFYKCKNLKKVTIKTKKLSAKNIGAAAFKGIHKKAVIKVPKAKLKAYKKILKKKGINGKKQKIKK